MGAYINPPNGDDKILWLMQHATEAHSHDPQTLMEQCPIDNLPVCLVDNGAFQAAAIGFNAEEVKEFAVPDGRMKLWYYAPIEKLHEVSPELVNYMEVV